MNDEELIQKIIEKDHFTFKLLVDQYQDLVLNACYNLIGNRQVAEDVSQEVLFQVYKTSEILQRSLSSVESYIHRAKSNLQRNLNEKEYQKIKDRNSRK